MRKGKLLKGQFISFFKEVSIIMDKKLFKKTYKFICSNCGEFSHTNRDYCETCGKENTIRKAKKEDFDSYWKKKNN